MKTTRIVYCYACLLLVLTPIHLPSFDSFYYWDWSRHLDLSYFDGGPMIAYWIRLSTLLFGDTLLALNLTAVLSLLLTSMLLYKTTRLLVNHESSLIATLFWLLSPLVTMDLVNQTTYDTPYTLFWMLIVYELLSYVQDEARIRIYRIGGYFGCLLLSKYSGILLALAIIVVIASTRYRILLKNKDIYLSTILACLIFSPVLIWNAKHQWISFAYQLNTHQIHDIVQLSPIGRMWHSLLTVFFPALNVALLPVSLYLIQPKLPKSIATRICCMICATVFLFYLLLSIYAHIRPFWLTPYLCTASILAGFCYQHLSYLKKPMYITLCLYGLISTSILVNSTTLFHFGSSPKSRYYHWLQTLNMDSGSIILFPDWLEARMLFFLNHKPNVYTLDCGVGQNQYAFWSESIQKALAEKRIKDAIYIDRIDRSDCIRSHFDACTIQTHEPLYTFRCSNR